MMLATGGLALLMLAITAATSADVPASSPFAGMPNVRFRYYDVEGHTPAEIYRSLRSRSPMTGDGVAKTGWHIKAGWRQARRGDTCEVDSPMTSLSIEVLMPRLATTDGVTPEGLAFWERTMTGLEIHEAGHARIAIEHRYDFVKAAAKATCGSIKDVAQRTQKRIEAIQEEYDRKTRHGMTQIPGAQE